MSIQTPYEQIGGQEIISQLVEAFYPKVFNHPDLIPLFIDGDMNEIMNKQRMFLSQFLGGPALYSEQFGPPAMLEKHLVFEITPTRAKAWLSCMYEAMDDVGLEGEIREQVFTRLQHVASIMVNTSE